jgi:hypothetical protein
VSGYGWQDTLAVVGANTVYLMQLGQFWGLDPRTRTALLVAVLCSGLIVRGLWLTRDTPVALSVIAYSVMLLSWAWPPDRFVVPLLPLVIWLACMGAGRLVPLLAVPALFLLATSGLEVRRLANEVREKGGTWFASGSVTDWREMEKEINWINRETPHDAVLIGIHDPTYYLFTGRQAVRPFSYDPLLLYYNVRGRSDSPLGTSDDFRKRLLDINADYVIATPRDGLEQVVTELLKQAPGSFIPVARTSPSGHTIYRIDRAHLSAASK